MATTGTEGRRQGGTNVRKYIDTDVLTEARKRMHRIYDLHDRVIVMFSGGKDSQVCVDLAWEVQQERGGKQVEVLFRDEELIPDEVLAHVETYRAKPWVKLYYLAVPRVSSKYVLGNVMEYTQWDPTREWIRPKPDHAITNADLGAPESFIWGADVVDHITLIAAKVKGKLGSVTGVRADEALMRYRAVLNKLHDCYMSATTGPDGKVRTKQVTICKPIYDWSEDDVFKFFYDRGDPYCIQYDMQLFARMALRVHTPLIPEVAKHFSKLREVNPVLYNQCVQLFPDMVSQERYGSDIDRSAVLAEYGQDMAGIERWIKTNLQGPMLVTALRRYQEVVTFRKGNPWPDTVYPPAYVFTYFRNGSFRHKLPAKA